MVNPKLNILVLEDNKDDAGLIKEIVENKVDTLNPTYVKSVAGAKDAFQKKLFHIVSLDQRIPPEDSPSPYAESDDNFATVIAAYEAHQPFATGVVFTGFESIERAVDSNKHGLEYLQKKATSFRDWGKIVASIRSRYFEEVLISRGISQLPSPLSISIKNIRDQEQPRIKLLAVRDLFENATQLFAAVIGAVVISDMELQKDAVSILKDVYRTLDRGNAVWKDCLKRLLGLLERAHSGYTIQIREEMNRFFFFGSGKLLEAIDRLHSLRNELAHDRLKKAESYWATFETCFPALHCLLEGLFLFALHPIFNNLAERRTSGDVFCYSADDLRGDTLLPPRINIESRDRLPTSELVWCLMRDAGMVQASIPLFPLLTTYTDNTSQHTGIYMLYDLRKGEYRELSTGRALKLPPERIGVMRQMLGK